jgi:biopolymer transport protein ExbD
MARTRSIRKNKRRDKKEPIDIDITSLLDILVILLVFLLRSYNSSGVTLTIPKGIELPDSDSITLNNPGVMIQVSKDKIWVDTKTILDVETSPKRVYDEGGRRIIPLFNELIKKKEQITNMAKQVPQAKKFSGIANLIIDKSLKYSYVKKIMYTCAAAGFKEYKFVVMGEQ